VDGIDVPQRESQEEREADDGAERAHGEGRQLPAARPRRPDDRQVGAAQQPGQRGAAGGDEERRQLRRVGGADREPRHRHGQGEEDDAEQAQGQASCFSAHIVHGSVSPRPV
jgi:hypothetical protein